MNNTYQEPSDSFIAIDLEYADQTQNICQFGLSVVNKGKVVEERCWAIQPPGNHYDQPQIKVHGMSAADTIDSPTLPQVWQEIASYLNGAEIWAHNAACVEQPILEKNLKRHGICDGPYTIHDSLHLYARPDRPTWRNGNGLRACLYAVGLPCDHHHDAGADATMCAQIIIAHQQGILPDWKLSDKMMEDYEATKQAGENHYQAQQLDLFGDVLSSTYNSDDSSNHSPSFFRNNYDRTQDGVDDIDYDSLNISDSNPVYGANVVITGFFHIARKHLREALKAMGAKLKNTVTKNVQVVLVGERNVGSSKIEDLQTLIHNGYNIARICGDADLDRLLYDTTLTPEHFAVPTAARKNLIFTIAHFNKHHHKLSYPVNSIASRELYFPPTGFMGRQDLFCQMCGNLGSFGNWDYNSQINLVVLPNSSVEALKRNEKDNVIGAFETYYNNQRTVTFDAEFITERDILKFVRERIVRCGDNVNGHLYTLYLQSAGIDPEKDFKYGLKTVRDAMMKER